MSRVAAVLSCVLVVTLLAAANQSPSEPSPNAVPNLAGTWKLDRDLTTADLTRVKTDVVVIKQSSENVRFEYYDRDRRRFGVETFITDGYERKRYVTRIERAYARAKWKDNLLVIRTRSTLDLEGYQSYELLDTWERSADGKTLTNHSSDGKATVYYLIDSHQDPPSPPGGDKP